jgi:hypothetical protein
MTDTPKHTSGYLQIDPTKAAPFQANADDAPKLLSADELGGVKARHASGWGTLADRTVLLDHIAALEAENKRLTGELDNEREYALKLQCAITGVAGGGSENFVKHGDGWRADIPFVLASIQRKRDDSFKAMKDAIIKPGVQVKHE